MSLNFIYGAYGINKDKILIEEISKSIKNPGIEEVTLIIPNNLQQHIHECLVKYNYIDPNLKLNTTTFKNLCKRGIRKSKYRQLSLINSTVEEGLIIQSLEEVKNKLKTYTNIKTSSTFKKQLISTIKTMRKSYINSMDLHRHILNSASSTTKDKLEDIYLILKRYEELLGYGLIDESKLFDLSSNFIQTQCLNSHIYIYGYNFFSQPELKLIASIIKHYSNTTICFDTPLLSNCITEKEGMYASSLTYNTLINLCKKLNISRCEDIHIKTEINSEKLHIGSNLFKYPDNMYTCNNQYIHVNEHDTVYDEILHIANTITDLVDSKKCTLDDIKICLPSKDSYMDILECVFEEFNIPMHVTINKNNIIKDFLKNTINLCLEPGNLELFAQISNTDIFNIQNNNPSEITKDLDIKNITNIFDNTIWIYNDSNEFSYTCKILELIKDLRDKIIDNPLDISQHIFNYLLEFDIESQINSITNKELRNSYIEDWNGCMTCIEHLYRITKITNNINSNYLEVFSFILENYNISSNELKTNTLDILSLDDINSINCEFVFIPGVNDGCFPSIYTNNILLTDKELANLRNSNIEIDKLAREAYLLEQNKTLKVLTSNSKKLILSYSLKGIEGSSIKESYIINRIKKILNVEPYPEFKKNNNWYNGRHSLLNTLINNERFNTLSANEKNRLLQCIKEKSPSLKKYTELISNAENFYIKWICNDKYTMNLLYASDTLSVSKLELYSKCPYSYYMKYGLGIKGSENESFSAKDYGIFVHTILETISKDIMENNKWESITEKELLLAIERELQNIKDKNKLLLANSKRVEYVLDRLKNVCLASLKAFKSHIGDSSFSTLGNEITFGDKGEFPPIIIKLPNRKRVKLNGAIDRVDICTINNLNLVRIIDYKTGKADVDFNKIYTGLQLQLFTYLNAILKNMSSYNNNPTIPAGVFYFNIKDPIIKKDSLIDCKKDSCTDILKELRMNGLYLKEPYIVKSMDSTLNQNSNTSINIKAAIKKDGQLRSSNNAISLNEMELLIEHTEKKLIKLSEELFNANINAYPIKYKDTTGCKYCDYSYACNFDDTIPGYNYKYITERTKDDVIRLIKNKKEGDSIGTKMD